ncbi:MAG: SpoIVB peptidase, partial [Clostridia bacterium]|nr:SpoIVB peptidase [Clostridia bacterium]
MNRQSFSKKAMQAGAWYLRFIAFTVSLTSLFSFALYRTESKGDFAVSSTAFAEELSDADYKAVASEPDVQNQSVYSALSRAELKSKKLYPGGIPFGIKFTTEGVLIVGFCDVKSSGAKVNPSTSAGLKTGDRIISIDSKPLTSAEELTRIVEGCNGRTLSVVYSRDGNERKTLLTPVYSESEGAYKTGIYVKDSGAGIGTVSYIDPETLEFGGLGHGVCEGESGRLVPISKGSVVDVNINGVVKGAVGTPGELKGYFTSGRVGSLLLNNDCGVFGAFASKPSGLPSEPISISLKEELKNGKAYIYTTLDGTTPQKYEIEISNIKINETRGKCFTVTVTDKNLLAKTGGIVQGMSGSPIIQNGKLVGAITHVLINDPSTGYGIFIENML